MLLSREQIIRALGDIDDLVVAEILAIGATPDELAEAQAWLANDEPLVNSGRPLPAGRVGRLADILISLQEEEMQSDPSPASPRG